MSYKPFKVEKRDGSIVEYDQGKIQQALVKAGLSSIFDQDHIMQSVFQYGRYNSKNGLITVEEIQDCIVKTLKEIKYEDIADKYQKYRHKRNIEREQRSQLIKDIEGLIKKEDKSILNENANKDSNLLPTQRDLLAGVVSKYYARNYLLPKEITEAHDKGYIHYHDLDYAPLGAYTNCCLVDLRGMLEEGFCLGNAEIDTPKSITTATAITAQIIAQVSSHQYGGTSINRIDEVLEKYVETSFNKHLKNAKKYQVPDAEAYANDMTEKEVYDSFQALEYEINTLHTANGQTPFVTLGFGLGTSKYARWIQEAILKVRILGLGKDHKTAVFPKLIFTLKDGVNLKPEDKNYDIKQLAIECTSKRIYPDILCYDKVVEITGDFKASMGCVDGNEVITYKENGKTFVESFSDFWDSHKHLGTKTFGVSEYIPTNSIDILDIDGSFTKVKGIIKNPDKGDWKVIRLSGNRVLHCTSDHPLPVLNKGRTFVFDIVVGDMVEGFTPEGSSIGFCEVLSITDLGSTGRPSFDVTTESDTFVVSGLASHNCRSFLSHWVNDEGDPIIDGRNNLGVVSLNLPRVAIESKGDIDKFWEGIDNSLKVAHKALLTRIERLRGVKASVAPILYTEGAFGVRMKPDDEILDLFKNGRASISLGYIGLHEMANAFFGNDVHPYDSKEKQEFMISVLSYLDSTTKKWKDEEGWGYSLYGTPSENLCDRFCRLDKKEFGEIEGVTNKGYYTNSFHLDVQKEVDPYSKVLFEEKFVKYSSGGHICYGEFPNLRTNLQAIEDVWNFVYRHVPYYGTNVPVDKCYRCEYEGEFSCTPKGFKCPQCGNMDEKTVSVTRRVCGYLGSPDTRPFNEGKQEEVSKRVKHMSSNVI